MDSSNNVFFFWDRIDNPWRRCFFCEEDLDPEKDHSDRLAEAILEYPETGVCWDCMCAEAGVEGFGDEEYEELPYE